MNGNKRAIKDILISDKQIFDWFEYANFGPSGESPQGRRGLMVECVLKRAANYSDGATISDICLEADLLDNNKEPTEAGIRWAFWQIYQSSGATILERLK